MSPRSIEQNQALRDESRAKIIAAGLRLFSAQGYERTSVRMIAEEAGVAQGLLYSHFAGKDDLLRAIFVRSVGDVRESFALAAAGDPRRSPVVRIVEAAFEVLRRNQEFWRLSYGVRMHPAVLAVVGGDVSDWTAEIRATLEAALIASNAAQPAVEAALLFATIDGVAQHFVLDPEGYPLDAVVAQLIARYGGTDGHSMG